jgi:hypothetical protein
MAVTNEPVELGMWYLYADIIKTLIDSVRYVPYVLTIPDMASMYSYEVTFDKFNEVGNCTNGNYAQKWITNFCDY